MEAKRDLNYEIKTGKGLRVMLLGAIMDVRRGELDQSAAKTITGIANTIIKHNVSEINNKKLPVGDKIKWFDEEDE